MFDFSIADIDLIQYFSKYFSMVFDLYLFPTILLTLLVLVKVSIHYDLKPAVRWKKGLPISKMAPFAWKTKIHCLLSHFFTRYYFKHIIISHTQSNRWNIFSDLQIIKSCVYFAKCLLRCQNTTNKCYSINRKNSWTRCCWCVLV